MFLLISSSILHFIWKKELIKLPALYAICCIVNLEKSLAFKYTAS